MLKFNCVTAFSDICTPDNTVFVVKPAPNSCRMADPERRRRRPALSCTLCRQRKIRCNRETPCDNCVRARTPNSACAYDTQSPLKARGTQGTTRNLALAPRLLQDNASYAMPPEEGVAGASAQPSSQFEPVLGAAHSTTTASTPASHSSSSDVGSLRSRIAQLEEQVFQLKHSNAIHSPATTPSTSHGKADATDPGVGLKPSLNISYESEIFGEALFTSRNVMHKRRVFGQSHCINGVAIFRDIFANFEPEARQDTSGLVAAIGKCKDLARTIKAQRAPPWPTMPTRDLPPRDVTDKLVECYLQTTESVYRILHLPTFWKDYEAVWASQTEPDMAQIVPLKLVLAIGTSTYDEAFSLREKGVRWVHEAYAWLSRPNFKSRVTIRSIQTHMLLSLAREACGVGWGMVWVGMGDLMRTAIYAGLHRDPSRLPRRSRFAAELRRRIWNTLLEMALHTSLNSGGPPLISLDDFDTQPPSNLDDEQLMLEDSEPKPDNEFTQISFARALRQTFAIRLTIAKYLNDLNSRGTYAETLRLDAELRAAYKAVTQNIQGWKACAGRSPSPSSFQVSYFDFVMRRSLLALHIPFFGPALCEAAYAFTRKVVIETSLILWRLGYGPPVPLNTLPESNAFSRLATCRSGNFRAVMQQASLFILAETRAQLRESDSLGVPVHPDLLPMLTESKGWCHRYIEAGETNIKGYILTSMIVAQVEGMMRGVASEEMPKLLIKAVKETTDMCLPILEEGAARGEAQTVLDQQPTSFVEDWDFTTLETDEFNNSIIDTMSWMFDDQVLQAPIL